jgi:hypothetical protein
MRSSAEVARRVIEARAPGRWQEHQSDKPYWLLLGDQEELLRNLGSVIICRIPKANRIPNLEGTESSNRLLSAKQTGDANYRSRSSEIAHVRGFRAISRGARRIGSRSELRPFLPNFSPGRSGAADATL